MPLPNLHTDLSDETRMRQRYLDLITREQARVTVRARGDRRREPALDVRVARLPRGRDPDAADDARGRLGAAVRHALQRLRHRAVPAHRARAVPQACRRRWARPGVRDQPQLPQRGRRLDPQPRVRDARGLPVVRRLQLDRRPHAGAHPERHVRGRRLARRDPRPTAASTTSAATGRGCRCTRRSRRPRASR